VVGHTVAAETELQLDAMAAMGINTVVFELRSADDIQTGVFAPPLCQLGLSLGPLYPDPDPATLANLRLLLDELGKRGMKMWLVLNNNHMEVMPPTGSESWLGAIFQAVGDHPALDLVTFGGAPHTQMVGDTAVCGIPAEAPLWMGPKSIVATYVKFAIGLGMKLGIPARKLSVEVVLGDFNIEAQTPAPPSDFTDGHLWSPVVVAKTIFDDLGIPADQRTYALSIYEHRKCSDNPQMVPCTDEDPHAWANETLAHVTTVVGAGPRIVAVEMGDGLPVDASAWSSVQAYESLTQLFPKYEIEGGALWRWVNSDDKEDKDPTQDEPIKRRGAGLVYNPIQKLVGDVAGWHLPALANGSFESGGDGVPTGWTADGQGTVSRLALTPAADGPEVAWRGSHAMRLVTGAGASDAISATSAPVAVTPGIVYTLAANLRFSWTGDPSPSAATRPSVSLAVVYGKADGTPSAVRPVDTFSWHQEDATTGFAAFVETIVPPSDAASAAVRVGAARNGLPTPITLDVDNVH
jgi:hypothetical protein